MPSRFPPPEIEGLLELEWFERLTEWRRVSGSDFWRLKRPVAVFLDEKFIGSDIELLKLTSLGDIFVEFVPRRDSLVMKNGFRMDYLARLRDTKLIHCYFDICVDDAFIGTLVFQLYSDILPKTCENFTTLCLGKKGSFFSYKGSRIHKIVKGGWLQGGIIQYKREDGGQSIYCSPLEIECYGISHNRRGVLSMVNDGKYMNRSQFVITLNQSTWMDNRYIAFGQLIEGVKVLEELEKVDTYRDCPLKKIEIKNCGKLNLDEVDDVNVPCKPDMKEMKVKKKPKIESIADQIMRLIMEALTERLAIKEHVPDVIHPGDVPSVMSLNLFFLGFYSLPTEVLEDSAKYIRMHRREFLRNCRPVATEVVEVITYDLLTAVFTKLVDLDDVREALSHPVYKKLLDGIDMNVEMIEKPYVKKFVNQLTTTAETMLKVLTRKLTWMRRSKLKARFFENQMNKWVQSFTLQETFADDNFRIADREELHGSSWNKGSRIFQESVSERRKNSEKYEAEGPCAEEKEKKKKKTKRELTAAEICCGGAPPSEEDPELSDIFNSCMYELKTNRRDRGGRISILDLIENGRYQLKLLRHHEERHKTKARICLEKKINRWMKDVEYTSETDWIRKTVFSKDDVCFSHTEEIMYGAMTIGLLEIYFLMESHLKQSGKRYITRIISTEDEATLSHVEEAKDKSSPSSESVDEIPSSVQSKDASMVGENFIVTPIEAASTISHLEEVKEESPHNLELEEDNLALDQLKDASLVGENSEETPIKIHKPCKCGHICCDCTSDPGGQEEEILVVPPTPPPSEKSLDTGEAAPEYEPISVPESEPEPEVEPVPESEPPSELEPVPESVEEEEVFSFCSYITEEFDINELLAQVMGESKERVSVKSFQWMRTYIEEEGCELKSEFARKVHNWLESEIFFCKGFLSKHSLVTRASLLSLSLSIASLIKEENELKSELKDFVFDLWELYFKEMIKEAILENPPKQGTGIPDGKDIPPSTVDPCSWLKNLPKNEFDFDKFCRDHGHQVPKESAVKVDETIKQSKPRMEGTTIPFNKDSRIKRDGPNEKVVSIRKKAIKEEKISKIEVVERIEVEEQEEEGEEGEAKVQMKVEQIIDVKEEESDNQIRQLPRGNRTMRVVRELVVSSTEIRHLSPYSLPFWVSFLTEITKRALGLMAKSSRLPRRLYFTTESQISFEDKIKEWVEFNNFSAPVVGRKDLQDFIASHHVELENLDSTARSFLRKHRISELMEKSSRTSAANIMAEELIANVHAKLLENISDKTENVPHEILQDLIATATIEEDLMPDEGEEEGYMLEPDEMEEEFPAE